MREMWDAAQEGDMARAREVDGELHEVYAAMSVTSPIPVKAALEMLGIASERMRLPMVPADDEQRAEVRAVLERTGLLTAAG
jgi:4-hydroxy-tetrahydrodipicolinate synthase